MNKLAEILEHKREEIKRLRRESLSLSLKRDEERFLFQKAMARAQKPFLIAEVKRKSPSQGDIAMEKDPVGLALAYKEGGADGLSVLTDERFFGGSFAFLREIKEATGLPVLCKDFIIDEVQIDMAFVCGADMILLIAEAFSGLTRLRELYTYASSLGMDVLVEVHDRANIRAIRNMGFPIVGVNNRDLRTLEEDYHYSLSVVQDLPAEAKKLSLSAIATTEAVEELAKAGYDGVLVGTSLAKHPRPQDLLAEWKKLGALEQEKGEKNATRTS
ncbi:MAG: indole-3-glycerol-phosphate synthase [Brevinematales bacterium]|nr:indole-3-glycerol-phosphate synthase [Brevinematales bacterium]